MAQEAEDYYRKKSNELVKIRGDVSDDEEVGEPAPKKHVGRTMHENAAFFKFCTNLESRAMLDLFKADQSAENFMIDLKHFQKACRETKRLPWVDICCDYLGQNSLCPYYLSAKENALEQNLSGLIIWMNPPFKASSHFVKKLEQTI